MSERGRPAKAKSGSVLSIYVPTRQRDRIVQLARREGVSVSQFLRGLLTAGPTSKRADDTTGFDTE